MNEPIQIQLGSSRSVNSINVDEFVNIELQNNEATILPYSQSSVINVAEIFDNERQASLNYRVYGDIDFLSVVNGLLKTYTKVSDFFTRPLIGSEQKGLTRNLLNCFDIYLCKLSTGHTAYSSQSLYNTGYEILTNLSDIEIYNSGYAKNIFNDQKYSFNFNRDFDITDMVDSFGKPVMNFYLFFNFKPSGSEVVSKRFFSPAPYGIPDQPITFQTYSAGDIVDGDLVFYEKANFEEVLLERQQYFVTFPVEDFGINVLQFKYYPFVPIKLRDFSDVIVSANISGTSLNDTEIPSYAVSIDNDGNYIWKNILENGYIDPISDLGVNHPFVNNTHYVFSNVILDLIPDLDNVYTETAFTNIKFGPNTLINSRPLTSLNNLGTKC